MPKARIPTVFGLMLVIGAIFVFSLIFERVTPLLSNASASVAPENIVVANISDTTFTVTWTTANAATGVLAVEEKDQKKYTVFDDRDAQISQGSKQPALGAYKTHTVTVRSAAPNTVYHTRIVSNGKLYGDGPKSIDVTTGPALSDDGAPLEPAFGSVRTPQDLPAEGALVYLALEGSQTLSTLVKSTGAWVIPLHLIRTEDLQSYVVGGERIAESLIVRSPDGDATAFTDTLNDNPVPAMAIGKSYDYRKIQVDDQQTQPVALNQKEASVLGTTPPPANWKITLTQPKAGATLPTDLPLFQGTGIPGRQVSLIIGITNPITGSISVETDGVWRYTPPKALSAGKQSVTMTTTDVQSKPVAITHAFEVLKSGTQVLGDATPSATIAPTPTTMVIEEEITPSPTDVASLAGDPIPEPGSSLPLIMLMIAGFGIMTTGLALARR